MLKNPYYISAALYCGFLFWLSSQSNPPDPDFDFPGKDKVAHMVLYAILAGMVSLGIRRAHVDIAPRLHYIIPVVIAAAYGLSDEIHQLFVPRRHFDLFDLGADIVGAILAQIVLCKVWWQLPWSPAPAETETG